MHTLYAVATNDKYAPLEFYRSSLAGWVLEETMTNELMTFERKITRKIFGRTRTADGYWRIKTNQEINDILKGQNIIGFIKKNKD